METREAGLITIYNRIRAQKDNLGLAAFRRSPTSPIDENLLPAIYMVEGEDQVVGPNSRGPNIYPARRMLEVILEMVVNEKNHNIKQLYRDVRTVVFTGGIVVADKTIIRETRAEGPNWYGLPDVIGMRLVLALDYTDDGL